MKSFVIVVLVVMTTVNTDLSINLSASKILSPFLPVNLPELLQKTTKNAINLMGNYGSSPGTGSYGSSPSTSTRNTGGSSYVSYDQKGSNLGSNAGFQPFKMLSNIFSKFRIPGLDKFVNKSPSAQYGFPRPPINQYLPPPTSTPNNQYLPPVTTIPNNQNTPPPTSYGVPNSQYSPPSSNTNFNPFQPPSNNVPNNSNPPSLNIPLNPIFPPTSGLPNNNYGPPPVDNQYLPPSIGFANNQFTTPSNQFLPQNFPSSNEFTTLTNLGSNNGNGVTINNPTTTGGSGGNPDLNTVFRHNDDTSIQVFGSFNENQFSNGFADQQQNDINGQNGNQFSSTFDGGNQNNNNNIQNSDANRDPFRNNSPNTNGDPTLSQGLPPWSEAQKGNNNHNSFNGDALHQNSFSNRNSNANTFNGPQWNDIPQWVGVHSGNSIQVQGRQPNGGSRNQPRKVAGNTIWDPNMLQIFRQAGGNKLVNPDLNSNVGQVAMGNYSINFCNRSCGEFTPLPGRSPTTLTPNRNQTMISGRNLSTISNIIPTIPTNNTQPRSLNLAQADDRIGSEETSGGNSTLNNKTETENSLNKTTNKEKHSNIPSIKTAQVLTHLSSFPNFLQGGLGALKYAPLAQSSKTEVKIGKSDKKLPEKVSETISVFNITITTTANPSLNVSLTSNQTLTSNKVNETISEWITEIEELVIEQQRRKRSTNEINKISKKPPQKQKLFLNSNSNIHLKKFANQLLIISKANHPIISSRKLLATINSEDANVSRLVTTAPIFTRLLHPNITNSLNLAKIATAKNVPKTLNQNSNLNRVILHIPTVSPSKKASLKPYISNGQQKIFIKKQKSKINQPIKQNNITKSAHFFASANNQELSTSPPQQISVSTASNLNQQIRIIRPSGHDRNMEVLPDEQTFETAYQPQLHIDSESQLPIQTVNSILQNDFSNPPTLEIVYQAPQNPQLATNYNSNIQNIRANQQNEPSSGMNPINTFHKNSQFITPNYQLPKPENPSATSLQQPVNYKLLQTKHQNHAHSDSNFQKHNRYAHVSPHEHSLLSQGQNSQFSAQPTLTHLYQQSSSPSLGSVNYHSDTVSYASEQSNIYPSQINIAYAKPQNANNNFLGSRSHQQPQFISNPYYFPNDQATYSHSSHSRIDAANTFGGHDGYLYHKNLPLHKQSTTYQLTHPPHQHTPYNQMSDANVRYSNKDYDSLPTQDGVHHFSDVNMKKLDNRKIRTSNPEHFQSFKSNDQWDAELPELMDTASDFQSSIVVNPPSNDRNSPNRDKKDTPMKKITTRYRHFPVSDKLDKENSLPDLKKDLLNMMHNLTKLMIETHDSGGKKREEDKDQVEREKDELEYEDDYLNEDDYILDTDSTEKRHINKWDFPKSPIHAALLSDDSPKNNEKQRMSGVLRIKSIKRTKNSQRETPRNLEQENTKGGKKDESTENLLRTLVETLTNLQEKKDSGPSKRGKESINMVVSKHETKISDSMTTEDILELLANKVLEESDDNLENIPFLQMLDKILDANGPLEGDINLNENVSLSKVTFLNELKNNLGNNQSNIPLHMQILKLPINKSNMLKLIIEAQVLNETNDVGSQGDSNISERLIRNPFQALAENTSNQGATVINSSNIEETTNSNGTTSHKSGGCHMCINIFQGPQSMSLQGKNSTDESGNVASPYQSPMSTPFKNQNNAQKDTYSAGISITQINYGDGSKYPNGNYSDDTHKEGWSPTSLHWVQGMNAPPQQPNNNNQLGANYFKRNAININHDPIFNDGGFGRDGILPVGRDVVLPVVREGEIQDSNQQYKLYGGSGGYVRFPRNKPFGSFRSRPEVYEALFTGD